MQVTKERGQQITKTRRLEERVHVALPLNLANADYVTRDISPSGVYFEADTSFTTGDRIDFIVEFPNSHLRLRCSGELLRKKIRNGRVGVAAKILESVLESV
ncbi:MAG: PilZ domain-containing protein [Nitrosomonadales bacterium]|nr:PilZ domain-containing protein [Nitrosomonadales bacterium]